MSSLALLALVHLATNPARAYRRRTGRAAFAVEVADRDSGLGQLCRRAERLAADLERQVPGLRELYVSELGAAIGAHVGPGAVGLVVAPAGPPLAPAQQDEQDPPQEAGDR